MSCQVAFVPNGTQVTITRNGKPLYSEMFGTGEEASAHAEAERGRMVDAGWAQTDVTGRSC